MNAADAIREKIETSPDNVLWFQNEMPGRPLGVVIPYRDREQHLKELIPHLISFFRRDRFNSVIKPLIVVSEQNDDRKFNRGRCCNGGFLAVEQYCDYVCFHDVDYLPIWADYSYAPRPTQIIRWGMDGRPIRVGPNNKLWVVANSTEFLGTIFVVDNSQFRAVNGFSNLYEGWGSEDTDLKERFIVLGLTLDCRLDGTFKALYHDHAGFTEDGNKNQDWIDNEELFDSLKPKYYEAKSFPEGLGTIPLGDVEVHFERWHGLDKSEELTICRLRLGL
jgi:N-terminal region of glycosyl transferase group 7/N-terminal domain of galactosyltransferase